MAQKSSLSVHFLPGISNDRLLARAHGAVLRHLVGEGVVGAHVNHCMSRHFHRLGDAQRSVECRDSFASQRMPPKALPVEPKKRGSTEVQEIFFFAGMPRCLPSYALQPLSVPSRL